MSLNEDALNEVPLNAEADGGGPQTHNLAASLTVRVTLSALLTLAIPLQAALATSLTLAPKLSLGGDLKASLQLHVNLAANLTTPFPQGSFTDTIKAEMAKMASRPVTILRMEWATGDEFYGDAAYTVTNWGGATRSILGAVQDWGKLDDVADLTLAATPIVDGDMTLTFLIAGGRDGVGTLWTRLLDRVNRPEQTTVSLYLWWRDLNAVSDPPVKMWEGTVGDWAWKDEQTLQVRFVDAIERLDRPAGIPLTTANWPNAHRDDVGKLEPICYGSLKLIPCLRVDAGAVSTLSQDLAAGASVLYFSESDAPLPNSGTGLCDADVFTWTGKTTETLNGVVHGKLTGVSGIDVAHNKGATVLEQKATAKFLAAGHKCKAVTKVYARRPGEEPTLQDGAGYTVDLVNVDAADGHQATLIKFTTYPSLPDKANAQTQDTIGGTTNGETQLAQQNTSTSLPASANLTSTSGADADDFTLSFNAPPGSPTSFEYEIAINVNGSLNTGAYLYVKHGGEKVVIAYYQNGVWQPTTNFVLNTNSNSLVFGHNCTLTNGSYVISRCARKVIGQASWTKTGSAVTHIGNVIAQTWVGVEVLADMDGYPDDALGTYTGTPSGLISLARQVMKHFLVTYLGLDPAKFALSSTLADRQGTLYKLEGCVREPLWAKDVAARLAFESGCWLKFKAGIATLILRERLRQPDAVLTTHRLVFLQGDKQTLEETRLPITAVVNEVNVRYDRDWSLPKTPDNYRSISRGVDAASQSRYGRLFNDPLLQMDFVRSSAQADALRDLYLGLYSERRQLVHCRTRLHYANVAFGDHVRLQDRMDPFVTGEVVSADYLPANAVAGRMPAFDFTILDIEEAEAMLPVVDKTGNYTLIAPADCETIFTNKGATGMITLSLPAAKRGHRYLFYVDAAQELRVDPNGSELFVTVSNTDSGSQTAQAAGKYLSSSTVRSWILVNCYKDAELTARRFGTWAVEA